MLFLQCSPIQLITNPNAHHYLYLGLSGIVGFTIGDFFTFNSFRLLGPKLSSVYTTIAPCSALVFGYFFLHESFNFIGVLGILITVGGVVWLTISRKDRAESVKMGYAHSATGILSGIAGAVCQGLGLVLSKYGFAASGEQAIPAIHAVWIRLLFAFLMAMLISFIINKFRANAKVILQNKNNGLKFLILGTILGPVCGVTFSLLSISYMRVAEAQTIFALLPIFVLPLNYLIHKEKITIHSLFAVLLAVSGVFILIWREQIALWI
ncbi:MAG: DMT family transporter [Sphingobacteriaceae bacterium]|nr:DMT family transporter [Sphingobacteriaceae bacterium]